MNVASVMQRVAFFDDRSLLAYSPSDGQIDWPAPGVIVDSPVAIGEAIAVLVGKPGRPFTTPRVRAPKTVRNAHGVLHRSLADAVAQGVLAWHAQVGCSRCSLGER